MSSGILGISKQVLRLPASQKAHQLRLTPLPPTLSLSSHSLSPPSPLLRLPRSYTSGRRALPQGFTFYPSFFSRPEQEVLLESALIALDKTGVGIRRVKGRRIKRRKEEVERDKVDKWEGLQGWFMHAGAYEFQEGHFDGVIKQYREALVKEGSLPDLPGRESPFGTSPDKLMERLEALFDGDEQGEEAGRRTLHVLHLGEEGSIQGHVDSQIAMGETIVGVSLGAERVLLLEKDRKEEEEEGEEGDDGPIEVLLPSGSVYVQRDEVRHQWKHAIEYRSEFNGRKIAPGQRMSIMLRDEKRQEDDDDGLGEVLPAPYELPSSNNPVPSSSHLTSYEPTPYELDPKSLPAEAGSHPLTHVPGLRTPTPLSMMDELILSGVPSEQVLQREHAAMMPYSDKEERERGVGPGVSEVRREERERRKSERSGKELIRQGMQKAGRKGR